MPMSRRQLLQTGLVAGTSIASGTRTTRAAAPSAQTFANTRDQPVAKSLPRLANFGATVQRRTRTRLLWRA